MRNKRPIQRVQSKNLINHHILKLGGDTTTLLILEEQPPIKVSIREALNISKKENLDLVLMSESPIVCKILDYNKMLYEKKKNENKSKKTQLKEIKLSYGISDNDINHKLKKADEFLSKGNPVKLYLIFKGREMHFKNLGFDVVNTFISKLEKGVAKESAKLEGRKIIALVQPNAK